MKDLSGTEAFLALAKHDFHSKDEAISIKTYAKSSPGNVISSSVSMTSGTIATTSGQGGGTISTATVRPGVSTRHQILHGQDPRGRAVLSTRGHQAA